MNVTPRRLIGTADLVDGAVTLPKLWGGARVQEWSPVHETLLDPTLMAVDGGGAPTGIIVDSGITVALDRVVTSIGAVSLKITIPQNVSTGKVVLPTPGGRVLGESVWRVRCDDWSHFTALKTYLCPNATGLTTSGYYSRTWTYSPYDYLLGFRQFPAVWNDTWRNVHINSENVSPWR